MHTTFRSPRFSINTNQDFARVLNERVSQYFSQKNKSKHANASMVFKTLFMLSLYLFPLVTLLWVSNPWISLLLWFIAGIGMAGVGLSVMHDANHGAYSSNRFVNKMVGGVLNIIGGNPTNWKIQHNVLHHTFTNVDGYDEDIAPPIPILRFSPHSAWKPVHKYQHIYAWFFYPLMTIMWYLTKDYKQAIRYHKQGLTASQGLTLSQHLFNIIFWKVVYTLLFIVIPIWLAPVSWYVIVIGFILMQCVAGLLLSLIFQPAHVIPDTQFQRPDDSGDLQADAKVHQLFTTANFGVKSRWFTWLVGGLNFQVEHHLFPTICHVHYRAISEIVKKTAQEYNLPYYANRTFFSAIKEHGRMLKMLGQKDCPEFVHL